MSAIGLCFSECKGEAGRGMEQGGNHAHRVPPRKRQRVGSPA
jgi:hypothetical protein